MPNRPSKIELKYFQKMNYKASENKLSALIEISDYNVLRNHRCYLS